MHHRTAPKGNEGVTGCLDTAVMAGQGQQDGDEPRTQAAPGRGDGPGQPGLVRGTCGHCGKPFEREPHPSAEVKYCSPLCRRKAKRKRSPSRRARKYLSRVSRPGPLCPHPYKKGFASPGAAAAFAAARFPDDRQLRPYRCLCGSVHLGHS